MDWWKLIGEILGFAATAVGFLIFQQKTRAGILVMKLICDLFWITHFLMLGAYSGMALSLVSAVRGITFFVLDRKKVKRSPIWLVLFLGMNLIFVSLAWTSPWSICSIISGQLATLAFWQSSPHRTKLLSLLVCLSQITYAFGIHSYSAILNELITLTSIGLFFLRWFREERKKRLQNNLTKSETTRSTKGALQ